MGKKTVLSKREKDLISEASANLMAAEIKQQGLRPLLEGFLDVINPFKMASVGFKKELEFVGVGYRASNSGQKLEMSLGYSHNVVFQIPEEVKVETRSEKGQNPLVILTSHDNQLLGLVAAKIRSLRKPEPYKGKGIKFVGEQLRRKAGKTAAS